MSKKSIPPVVKSPPVMDQQPEAKKIVNKAKTKEYRCG